MGKTIRKTLFCLLLIAPPLEAATGTITIQPDAAGGEDIYIGTASPIAGNGLKDTLFVGIGDSDYRDVEPEELPGPEVSTDNYEWRSLLRFDIPTLPTGASILSAELSLYLNQFSPLVTPFDDPLAVTAHGIETSWIEGTGSFFTGANWLQSQPGIIWITYGGDYGAPVAETSLSEGQGGEWISWEIAPLVESWLADPDSNFGVMLKRDSGDRSLAEFYSSDVADPSLHPKLVIVYDYIDPDSLPPISEGAAEIVPSEVPQRSREILTLYADLHFLGEGYDTGINRLRVPLPSGFEAPTILSVTHSSSSVRWADMSSNSQVRFTMTRVLQTDGLLTVRFEVDTPDQADTIGQEFIPYVNLTTTSAPEQALEEGDANGVPTDENSLRVRVLPGPLAFIHVAPAAAALSADSTLLFVATGEDSGGFPIPIDPDWSVEGGIGTIDESGLFEPETVGEGIVVAAVGEIRGEAPVSVTPGDPVSLGIGPADTTITADDSLSFTATGTDAEGNGFPLSPLWDEPTGLGSIDGTGVFVPLFTGEATIVAEFSGLSDTAYAAVLPGSLAALVILPASATVHTEETIDFTATGSDGKGNLIEKPAPLAWSGASSIGSIDPASGRFEPTTPGADSVRVVSGTVSAWSGPITVVPGPTRSIEISPADLTIFLGEDTLFTAVPRDGEGNETTDTPAWAVTGGVGQIDGEGMFTATAPGMGSVVASAGGLSDTAGVIVSDNHGLSLLAVLEERDGVTRGEAGIPVSLSLHNQTGDAVLGLSGSLRFRIGLTDVSGQYDVAPLAWERDSLPDGASDTLRFLVDVAPSASTGAEVTIDGSIAATLRESGAPVADLQAETRGGWTVTEAPSLSAVGGSLFPSRATVGAAIGFSLALRNSGGTSLLLETGTVLTFSDGKASYAAPLAAPAFLSAGGGTAQIYFEGRTIPAGFHPGKYTVTVGAVGTDGNGGAYTLGFPAEANEVELLPPYVAARALPVEGGPVHPGDDSLALFRLELANLYTDERTLSSLEITNDVTGPGTVAERDSVWEALRLVRDIGGDGVWNGGDPLLSSGTPQAGGLVFGGLSLPIAGEDTLFLLVTGHLSAAYGRDGDELNLTVSAASHVAFDDTTDVAGQFPLDSPGSWFVDGFLAERLAATGPSSAGLPASSDDSLALSILIPSNGYALDTLRSLTVANRGTALAESDLTEVRLWKDGGNGLFDRGGGDDTNLGVLFWTGDGWTRSGIGLPLPKGGVRVFLTVDTSADPTDQRTVRLAVPVDGIGMASSNDGPIDKEARSPVTQILGGAERIQVERVPGTSTEDALPGEADRVLLQISVTNIYSDSVYLEALTVTNESEGIEPDSVLKRVKLLPGLAAGAGKDGGPAVDPIAVSPFVDGTAALGGFSLPIAPGESSDLSLAVDVGLHCVADGETASLSLAGGASFSFRQERSVFGLFPLSPPLPVEINGMSAAQVGALAAEGGALVPSETDRLAFQFTVPSNGCSPDTLLGLRIANDGDAGENDLSRLQLYSGGENEIPLGDLVWNGSVWAREGLSLPVASEGETLKVRVDAAPGATSGRTVRLLLPLDGLSVASENDGPVDEPVVAPTLLQISTSPIFASWVLPSDRVTVGQAFTVEMIVRNVAVLEPDTLLQVFPDSFLVAGTNTTVLSTPDEGPADTLAPGEEARFSWEIRADEPGELSVLGTAAGILASTGEPIETFIAESPPLVVESAPSGLVVTPVSTLPAVLTRGDRDVPLMVLTLNHGDEEESGAASITVDTIRVSFEDTQGRMIPVSDIAQGLAVGRGGSTIGLADPAGLDTTTAVIPLAQPVRIAPGGDATLSLRLDVSQETGTTRFLGLIADDSYVSRHDVNSGAAVPIEGALPFRTRQASVIIPPTSLQVEVTGGLPARVNRGASTPILQFELESKGTSGVTSDVSITVIQFILSDGRFPFEYARVDGPGITHFSGDGWSVEDSVISFPLNPSLTVPVNDAIDVSISGRVEQAAPLGRLRLGLQDSIFVNPRTSGDDAVVEVELMVTEELETEVMVRTDSIHAAGIPSADSSIANPGDADRDAFGIRFLHPGGDSLSPVSVISFPIRIEDAAGDSVGLRALLDEARVVYEGTVIASAAPLLQSAASLELPFDQSVLLAPGESADVFVRIDIKADALPGDYRFTVGGSKITVTEENEGTDVDVRFLSGDGVSYRTDLFSVRRVSDRLDVWVDLGLPATAVGGSGISGAGEVRFLSRGGEEEADLHLKSFTILVESEAGASEAAGALAGAAVEGDPLGGVLSGELDHERVRFLFDPPLALAPAETLALALDLLLAEDPSLPAFRVRLPVEEIGLEEEEATVGRAAGDTGSNPSPFTHFAARDFQGSLRNYPNPFTPDRQETRIAFYARDGGKATVRIYTGLGVAVRTLEQNISAPGLVEIPWDGRNGDGRQVLSGAYLASVQVIYDDGGKDHAVHKIAVLH